jgi:hypothetical protein
MSGLDLRFEAPAAPPRGLAPARTPREAARAAAGWLLLAFADLAVKAAGFHRFYRMVERWPTRGSVPPERRRARAEEICTAVDRARTAYFKHAWCLQRAAASVIYLRLCGVRGELVIGVRKIPFQAHAWTEVDGAVVNDPAQLGATYAEIARC